MQDKTRPAVVSQRIREISAGLVDQGKTRTRALSSVSSLRNEGRSTERPLQDPISGLASQDNRAPSRVAARATREAALRWQHLTHYCAPRSPVAFFIAWKQHGQISIDSLR